MCYKKAYICEKMLMVHVYEGRKMTIMHYNGVKQFSSLSLLLCVLVFASGCSNRKKPQAKSTASKEMVMHEEKSSQNPAMASIAESLDTFVLQEEENPFTRTTPRAAVANESFQDESLDDASLSVAQTQQSWEDLRADQVKHGFKNVQFDFDRSDIRPDQMSVLEHDYRIIKKELGKKRSPKSVVIEGHADRAAGSAVYNMMLSEKRAEHVASWLAEKGIPAEKMNIVGRGYEMPLVTTGGKEAQAPNRRVEFFVMKSKK